MRSAEAEVGKSGAWRELCTWMGKERSAGTFDFAMTLPATVIVLVIALIPTLILVVLSFAKATPTEFRFQPIENYRFMLFEDPIFWTSMKKSLIYMGVSVSVSFVIAMIVALATSHKSIRLAGIWRALIMIPWAMPLVVSGFIWMWILHDVSGVANDFLMRVGLINAPIPWLGEQGKALFSVILADIWTRVPLMFIILLAALQSIPPEINEAAMIDGANPVQRFYYITIPFIQPALYFVLLINSIFAMRTFAIGQVMTMGGPGDATYLLVIYIFQTITHFFRMGRAATLSMALFMSVVLLTIFWSLVFRRSLRSAEEQ